MKKITRHQLDKLIEDIKTARLYLTILISDKKERKEIAEKTGVSYSYLTDAANGRKIIGDKTVIEILNKWVS